VATPGISDPPYNGPMNEATKSQLQTTEKCIPSDTTLNHPPFFRVWFPDGDITSRRGDTPPPSAFRHLDRDAITVVGCGTFGSGRGRDRQTDPPRLSLMTRIGKFCYSGGAAFVVYLSSRVYKTGRDLIL
jgi:hypothetical protein